MRLPLFLPHLKGLRLTEITTTDEGATLHLFPTRRTAHCPSCRRGSQRVHSRDDRTIVDLPWGGVTIRLRLQVRRVICGVASCPQRIFAERLPQRGARYARRTHRLPDALQQIGLALGGAAGARLAARPPTPRQVALLCLRRPEQRTSAQQAYLDRLRQVDEAVAGADILVQDFAALLRERRGERLDDWLAKAEGCPVPALHRFATGLRGDLDAVRAGLTEPGSNGPTEGFVHKLELRQRQGYGRAGCDRWRQRLRCAACRAIIERRREPRGRGAGGSCAA